MSRLLPVAENSKQKEMGATSNRRSLHQQRTLMEAPPYPLSSRAKPRDLQFPRTFPGDVFRRSEAESLL